MSAACFGTRVVPCQGERVDVRLDRSEARGGLTECRHPPTPKQLAGMTTGWAGARVGYNMEKLFSLVSHSLWFIVTCIINNFSHSSW